MLVTDIAVCCLSIVASRPLLVVVPDRNWLANQLHQSPHDSWALLAEAATTGVRTKLKIAIQKAEAEMLRLMLNFCDTACPPVRSYARPAQVILTQPLSDLGGLTVNGCCRREMIRAVAQKYAPHKYAAPSKNKENTERPNNPHHAGSATGSGGVSSWQRISGNVPLSSMSIWGQQQQ